MSASRRVLSEWRNRAEAEYSSAAVAARVVHNLIATGMPRALIHTGQRIVNDELDHAELSLGVWRALGGEGEVQVDVTRLTPPEGAPLLLLAEDVLRAFCVGETVAVPLFAAMRAGAEHPAVLSALERILRDEAVHRAFGWDALEALVALDPAGVPPFMAQRLPEALMSCRKAYVVPHTTQIRLAPEERAAGLIDLHEYEQIVEACVEESILPRFARLGITPALETPSG